VAAYVEKRAKKLRQRRELSKRRLTKASVYIRASVAWRRSEERKLAYSLSS